jgi:DNA-binding transcriptional regulator YhcF (GntR family)
MYNVVHMGNIMKINNNNILSEILAKAESIIIDLLPIDSVKFQSPPNMGPIHADFMGEIFVQNQRLLLVGEIDQRASLFRLQQSLMRLRSIIKDHPMYIPFVISKYFSPQKRDACKKMGINFMDLSGNIYLKYGNLFVERVGFPNLYPEKRRGRGIFSDKASLILRALLIEDKAWGVRELAEKLGLDPGYVSRLLRELSNQDYLIEVNGKSKLKEPRLLLEDWLYFYDFKKNKFHEYFCMAKSASEIIEQLQSLQIPERLEYALGFQSGAFLVSPHAIFDCVHIYIPDKAEEDYFVKELNLHRVEKGTNLVCVSPYYRHSIFYDKQKIQKLWVVSDIQLYLDLYKFPLRGLEQAEHIYDKRLKNLIER